jgi:acyl carrier protein
MVALYDYPTYLGDFRTMPKQLRSLDEVQSVLASLIKKASVEDPNCTVSLHTIPNTDIKGFDSLTVLEVLTELEEETGIHVDEIVFGLERKPREPRTLEDIAIDIWNRIGKENAHA